MSSDGCSVLIVLEFLKGFAKDKMCGKCLPCMFGTVRMIDVLERITNGKGEEEDIVLLDEISSYIVDTARCKLGKDAATFVKDSLSSSKNEYEEHIKDKYCAQKSCEAIVSYQINSEKCTICGACKEVCPEDAIVGEKMVSYLSDNKPYYIKNKKCIKCGECLAVCEADAIEIV